MSSRVSVRRIASTVTIVAALAIADTRAQSTPPVVDVQLDARFAALRPRIELAAREAATRYTEWLGPFPQPPLIVTTTPAAPGVTIDLPWRSSPPAMDVEREVCEALARAWWRARFGEARDQAAIDGIARYLQSRVMEVLFDYAYHQPGHSADTMSFFGGTITRAFPAVRLGRWTAGLGRAEWLRTNDPALRIAIELASFERAAGWPVLQGILYATLNGDRPNEPLTGLLNAAAAQPIVNLDDRIDRPDFAVASVTSAPCQGQPCFSTFVTVINHGTPVDAAVPVRVVFIDGQQATVSWDDGKKAQQFTFSSPTPFAAVLIDPDRTRLLDTNLLNNSRLAPFSSNVPLTKWMSRWTVWFQDALLTYSALF